MPVIRHGQGICHVFVDADADLEMAVEIAFNAKVQRPGVCNAMETLLVHSTRGDVLEKLGPRLVERGVELRADAASRAALARAGVTARVVSGNLAALPVGTLLEATVTSVRPREVALTVNGQPLQLNLMNYDTPAGTKYSVKTLRFVSQADELGSYELKPNYRALGPRFGK